MLSVSYEILMANYLNSVKQVSNSVAGVIIKRVQ